MTFKLDSRGQDLPVCPSGQSARSDVMGRTDCSHAATLEISGPTERQTHASQALPLLFWKALVGLLMFDVLGFGRDFARMHRVVTDWSVAQGRVGRSDAVQQVCRAVNYACVWYPKQVLCLQRSAVTTCLMRHHGIPATMVLGAQTLPFKAHAWTEVEGRAVNERRDVQSIYAVWERC